MYYLFNIVLLTLATTCFSRKSSSSSFITFSAAAPADDKKNGKPYSLLSSRSSSDESDHSDESSFTHKISHHIISLPDSDEHDLIIPRRHRPRHWKIESSENSDDHSYDIVLPRHFFPLHKPRYEDHDLPSFFKPIRRCSRSSRLSPLKQLLENLLYGDHYPSEFEIPERNNKLKIEVVIKKPHERIHSHSDESFVSSEHVDRRGRRGRHEHKDLFETEETDEGSTEEYPSNRRSYMIPFRAKHLGKDTLLGRTGPAIVPLVGRGQHSGRGSSRGSGRGRGRGSGKNSGKNKNKKGKDRSGKGKDKEEGKKRKRLIIMFFIIKLCLILIWSHLLTFVSTDNTGVWCYDCNSKNDKNCVDEYQKYENECPVHNINESVSLTPTGCRKIIQIVDDDTTIIRECAYSGELMNNQLNMGSVGVKRYMTQCNQNFCNSSNKIVTSCILFFLSMILFLYQIFT
ncbi:Hypothetical protein SRAE_2000070800 [Strongyloides ratti]|uniref:Protein sleepless n=1 Tax=Strongyloides ratti TaxID=34506 RepID=A0A090L8B7_STRRB|nr:Hypothetical protein SRAE_2000070800 [Strongyloides ratti]CEF66036.1 Hypothetical protein SRAE_2000070800 [Strongyloides ratti]